METPPPAAVGSQLAGAFGRLAQRMLVIGENRMQLLLVEVQEERERFLRAIWLAMAVAVFGLLAGVTLTLVVALVFWEQSPVIALLILGGVYTVAGAGFFLRLLSLQRDWQTLPATIDQLRKDRECLEKSPS